jgi:hypothetical protein
MVTANLTSGDGERGRRGAGPAVAISLVVHALAFLAIGLITPRPQFVSIPPSPPLTVILLPSPEEAHPTRQPEATTPARTAGSAAAPLAVPRIHVPRALAPSAAPSPVAAAPAAATPGPASSPGGRPGSTFAPAPLPYEEGDRGVRALLRATVGCETPDAVHLTPEERARCTERLVEIARNAHPFSGVDPARRAAWDALHVNREGVPNAPIVSCQGQGSNFGVGCLPDSAIGRVKIP